MARVHLTDAEWAVIERLLPMDVRGKERVDDRRVLNGIVWRLRMGGRHPGALWPAYDLWQPVPAWRKCGRRNRPLDAVSKAYDDDLQMIDATTVRVHPHPACAPKTTADPVAWVARAAA